MNYNKGHICSVHWIYGERKSINDLTNCRPVYQLLKVREKFETENNILKNIKLHHKNYIYDTKMPNVN